jgi:hypothetical protein
MFATTTRIAQGAVALLKSMLPGEKEGTHEYFEARKIKFVGMLAGRHITNDSYMY